MSFYCFHNSIISFITSLAIIKPEELERSFTAILKIPVSHRQSLQNRFNRYILANVLFFVKLHVSIFLLTYNHHHFLIGLLKSHVLRFR